MKTVNSLSGGKTSSYMAAHYPADYNVFALVCIDDVDCAPKDKKLIEFVSNKIGRDFIATAEDDKTMIAMMDLEQKIGSEITWVVGNSFDAVIEKKKYTPNRVTRFCTTETKMRPIFRWWKQNINEIIEMRIGFRWDEKERADKITNTFKDVVGKRGGATGQNKWEDMEWRVASFPLIEDKVIHPRVKEWADNSGIIFPQDSNCVGCFWKSAQQLRKNWEDNPAKLEWFARQEKYGRWKSDISYKDIKNIGLQSDFFFGEGSGCAAGYCTD